MTIIELLQFGVQEDLCNNLGRIVRYKLKRHDTLPEDEYGAAKSIILKMLRDGQWVLGDDILAAVKQSYYDRRIRELRDEDGWEIETGWLENVQGKKRPAYRLKSHKRRKGIKRPGTSTEDRAFVLKRDNYTCQLCGADLHDGENNPQIDHKVPLLRDGPSEVENYQAICSNCNVVKRGICKKCTLPTCDNCYLAYPEKGANNLLVSLTEVENEYLSKLVEKYGLTRVETLRRLITRSLNH